jgi:diguanylate cyclase (GGDEF)-like protein
VRRGARDGGTNRGGQASQGGDTTVATEARGYARAMAVARSSVNDEAVIVQGVLRSLRTYRSASAVSAAMRLACETLGLDVAALLLDGHEIFSMRPRSHATETASVPAASPQESAAHHDPSDRSVVLPTGRSPKLGALSVRFQRLDGPSLTTCERILARVIADSITPTNAGLAILVRECELAHADSDPRECDLLKSMLHDRDALLRRLSGIQRALSQRAPLQEILDAIVAAAVELIGDETVNLRLLDPDDPTHLIRVAGRGYSDDVAPFMKWIRPGDGAVGRAYAEGRLVVMEDYTRAKDRLAVLGDEGIEAAMSAPVEENGRVIGALTVATHRKGRTYSETEQQMLVSIAAHASVALTNVRSADSMEHLAFHDPLTGLPNRALFVERVARALARGGRTPQITAVLFADLDNLKSINDTLGHAAGDQLLTVVARRLQESLRPSDTAARFGGDEFAVLLENIGGNTQVIGACERIMASLTAPVDIQGSVMHPSASIGVALSSRDAFDAESLLRHADLAMYSAKAAGKGTFEIYESPAQARAHRLQLASVVAQAFE